jgi:predicted GIY-YIG superfamily endonuclease
VLIDPHNDEIRYVGSSRDPHKRLGEHLSCCNPGPKRDWIEELAKQELRPQLSVVESCETTETALSSEAYWIHRYIALGANLLNYRGNLMNQTNGVKR